MPHRLPHSCAQPGCSHAAPAGQPYCDSCQAKRPATEERAPSPVAKLYQTRRWKDATNGVAALVRVKNPTCQFIDERGVQCTHASAVVHHLVDPKDNPTLFFDWQNLVAVCVGHHQGGQRGETQGYRYCHTMGALGAVYFHGYLFPVWHEKYVPQSSEYVVDLTTSSVGTAAILKALAEPI